MSLETTVRIVGALAFGFFACLASAPTLAEDAGAAKKAGEEHSRGLPPEVVTSHTITVAGEKIAFLARAGAVRLYDAQSGAPRADVAYVSYERADADPLERPVAFVFNGGPGAASAWLGLGALSPWRLRFDGEAPAPSTPPLVIDNAESWIPFADLVLVDPPGVGYSKFLGDGEDVRSHFFSVQGDVDALAVVVRKWLTTHRRAESPKYLVGESYGGFRVVKLARALSERENVGVDGLVLVSPILDFAWREGPRNLLSFAAYLPSFAAVARVALDRAELADVEAYAAGEYVLDLLKGVKDADAVSRVSANVARLAGLERETVARLAGRVDVKTFARERRRAAGRVLSVYDAEVSGYDPTPFARDSDWPDPMLDSLRAPLGAAMSRIVVEKLGWPVGDARYEILDDQVARHWDFGHGGRANAEALTDLGRALALDRRLEVLVVHGLADLVTPYFATKLQLDQLPAFGEGSRVRLIVLPGGHMPYTRDDARKSLRDAARALIETKRDRRNIDK